MSIIPFQNIFGDNFRLTTKNENFGAIEKNYGVVEKQQEILKSLQTDEKFVAQIIYTSRRITSNNGWAGIKFIIYITNYGTVTTAEFGHRGDRCYDKTWLMPHVPLHCSLNFVVPQIFFDTISLFSSLTIKQSNESDCLISAPQIDKQHEFDKIVNLLTKIKENQMNVEKSSKYTKMDALEPTIPRAPSCKPE